MKRRGRLKPTTIATLLLLVLAGAYAAYYAWVEVQLNEELRLFREAGFPTSREELLAMYTVPADPDNGAAILEQAFALYPEDSEYTAWDKALLPLGSGRTFPDPSGPLPDDVRQAINDYLSAHRDAIALLHEGTQKPVIQFTPRPGPTPEEPLDLNWHAWRVVGGVDTLLREAALWSDRGDVQRALDGMADAKALGDSLAHFPGVSSAGARARCQRDWIATLAYLCGRQVLTPNDLETLAGLLDSEAEPGDVPHTLAEHAAVVESMLDTSWSRVRDAVDNGDFEEPGSQGTNWADNLTSVTYLAVFMPARLHCRAAMHHMRALRHLGRAERTCASYAELLAEYRLASANARDLPRYCRASRFMLPGLERMTSYLLSEFARIPCARVALAIEQYRAATGNLPESLEALVPDYLDAVPVDPWAPGYAPGTLKYTHGPGGYTVYSVGTDGQDDGGDPARVRANSQDVCFVVGKGGPLPVPDATDSGGAALGTGMRRRRGR
jgi:hypothetical protein